MEDYPALMPPAAVPALMQQPEMGALWPRAQFAVRNAIAQALLPFYNHISQKSRDPNAPLSGDQIRWDEYVKSVLEPQSPPSRLSPYINGTIIPSRNTNNYVNPPMMVGVRS